MRAARPQTNELPLWQTASDWITRALDDGIVIRALILRNLTVGHRHNPLWVFSEVLQPVAICLAHYFYFTMTNRPVPGNQYAIFTIGGFAIYFTFISAYAGAFEGGKWPQGADQMPGVTRMHLRAAKVVWTFLLYLTFAFAIVIPLKMMGQTVAFPDFLITLSTFAMAAGLGFGYGLVANGIGVIVPAAIPFIKILQWAVFITSGVYDSLVTMPRIMAVYIWYNPIIHLAEYQRYAYYDGYPIYLVSLAYPLVWVIGLTFAGLLLNRALCNRRYR